VLFAAPVPSSLSFWLLLLLLKATEELASFKGVEDVGVLVVAPAKLDQPSCKKKQS